MKVRVFYPNKDNKIEFTKKQLEELLNEVYEEGHTKGWEQGYSARRPTIISPYTPYWSTAGVPVTTTSITIGDEQ